MDTHFGAVGRSSERLAGQVAVVTGASSGLDHGIVRSLAQAGAAVVIDYSLHEEDARQLAAEINGAGGRALTRYMAKETGRARHRGQHGCARRDRDHPGP